MAGDDKEDAYERIGCALWPNEDWDDQGRAKVLRGRVKNKINRSVFYYFETQGFSALSNNIFFVRISKFPLLLLSRGTCCTRRLILMLLEGGVAEKIS